jgi:diketogulonate reductase-like aldo/keto reductase
MLGGRTAEAVASALKSGYRHIDTAWKYGTEDAVGEGIRASGMPREEVFLTTKVSHEYLRADDFERSTNESLRTIGVDYVDLLLIHWPNPEIPLAETIGALVKMKRLKLARHIGVANFPIALLDRAVALCEEPLVTNQIEVHPYLDQAKVLAACRGHGMVTTAYCPLARGRLFTDPVIAEIAQEKRRTIAQVALRWLIQQGNIVPIPRSSNPRRIAENIAVFDFVLSDAEMTRISALNRANRRIANPVERVGAWD